MIQGQIFPVTGKHVTVVPGEAADVARGFRPYNVLETLPGYSVV
jgi:hypothetical protein